MGYTQKPGTSTSSADGGSYDSNSGDQTSYVNLAAQYAASASSTSRLTMGTTTTLSAGEPATVSIIGPSGAQQLNIGIPTGPTGATGPQGIQGIQGIPGEGTVNSVSVVSANGLAGTVANASTTPAITLSTTVNGLIKGDGTALSAATVRTDYAEPTTALATGILRNTTGTGAHTIAVAGDFPTLDQDTTGSAASLTTARTIGGSSFNGTTNVTSFPVPGPIGGTTPSTGAFTTLTTTGNVTLGGASTDTLNVGNGGIIKDASNNVGIGITPTTKLDVRGTTRFRSGSRTGLSVGADSGATTTTDSTIKVGAISTPHYLAAEEPMGVITGVTTFADNVVEIGGNSGSLNSATIIKFFTAPTNTTGIGTERCRIDASGNLGIGVTPSAWSSLNALQVRGTAHLAGFSSGSEGCFLASNAFFDGAVWKYQIASFASYFRQSSGSFQWFTAPSGTAGDPITFTQAMTLDVSGRLLVPNGTVVAPVAFASLPASPVTGQRAMINNSVAAPAFLSAAAGGGAVTVPVFYNGSAWLVG